MTTRILAASTLGALDETPEQVAAAMARHGARAVELRTADDAPVHVGLTGAERAEVRALWQDAGLDILSVASRVRIADGEPGTADALRAHLQLAADLGAPYVRVFPGAPAAPAERDEAPRVTDPEAADDAAVAVLDAVAADTQRLDVRVLLETHDSHPRGADVARVLARVDAGGDFGAIWDLLHPWRVGEPLAETARALLPHLLDGRGFVQFKDVADRRAATPLLQGTGTVPLGAAVELLDAARYAGPYSLEWERHWHPEAAPLADALAAAAAALALLPTP